MDPLSVAASVAGLLQIAAKVISFLSTAIDAPSTARNALAEVQALHGIFRQLDGFIVNFAQQSMARKSRIEINDLVVILTGCVCTFSELDRELEDVKKDYAYSTKYQFRPWDSVKWAAKDQDIAKILRNLQMHKTSLNLLLSVYTCASTLQLQSDMDELKQFMATVREAVPDLVERIAATTSSVGNVAASSVRSRVSIFSSASVRSFPRILAETRLYRKAARNSSTHSFKTIDTTESKWSQLTGLSLAQISNISVIYLPIYSFELNNGHMYEQQKSSNNVVQLLNITVGGLQRLQRSSSKMTTTVRLRLIPVTEQVIMLHDAARKGDNATVNTLVETLGIHKDSRDEGGYTALHYAVIFKQRDTVLLLLDLSADTEAKATDDRTPLHLVVDNGHIDTLQLLLDRGAEIEAKGSTGWTPLHRAAWKGHPDTLQLLLDRGADIEAKGSSGRTPLLMATLKGHTDTLRLLLDRGAEIEAKGSSSWTPLHLAACNGHTETLQLLLGRGADIGAKATDDWTPLHLAVYNGHMDPLKLLLERGGDIAPEDREGRTAGQLAVQKRYEHIARLLLDRETADAGERNEPELTGLIHISSREEPPRGLVA